MGRSEIQQGPASPNRRLWPVRRAAVASILALAVAAGCDSDAPQTGASRGTASRAAEIEVTTKGREITVSDYLSSPERKTALEGSIEKISSRIQQACAEDPAECRTESLDSIEPGYAVRQLSRGNYLFLVFGRADKDGAISRPDRVSARLMGDSSTLPPDTPVNADIRVTNGEVVAEATRRIDAQYYGYITKSGYHMPGSNEAGVQYVGQTYSPNQSVEQLDEDELEVYPLGIAEVATMAEREDKAAELAALDMLETAGV